jgi:hypothetical protein
MTLAAQAYRLKAPPLAHTDSQRMCVLLLPPSLPHPATTRRGKTNFFEKRVGEYQKSGVMAGLDGAMRSFQLDADF